MIRYILLLVTFTAFAVGQRTPSIAAITNAALPGMDTQVPARLQPRSMASIFGSNLSTTTASTAPPRVTGLGGIELHFLTRHSGCGTSIAPCEVVASLIFVSPTQINFLVPDISFSAYGIQESPYGTQELEFDAIIVENGQRYDTGGLIILSTLGDLAVFGVGYD